MPVPNSVQGSEWSQSPQAPTQAQAATLQVRRATAADIPFLAQVHYEASLPPLNHCLWQDILQGTDTATQPFLEALYRTDACAWGTVTDAFILEENGSPVAGATGYVPKGEDYRILNPFRLTDLAAELQWSAATADLFWHQYEAAWGTDPQNMALKPHATWIIEFVAVVPEARGRGLVKVLLNAILETGRQQSHTHAGIMVIQGNDRAQRSYESLGFKPYISFAPDYFEDQFPGLTRLRLRL